MCQQNLIETLYVPVVFIFPNRKFKPKLFTMVNFYVNNDFNVLNVRNLKFPIIFLRIN